MLRIEITHNPFTVQTDILVNDKLPAESSPLSKYKDQRLHRWVEGLFDDLSKAFNDAKNFALIFTGVEADWLDIKEAAEKARGKGMKITLEHTPFAKSGEERLKELIALKDKAGTLLDLKGDDFKRQFAKALDKDFDVFVVATVSSGKSTLLNAILGVELLPVANKATTAKLTEIYYNNRMPEGVFKAQCETEDGRVIETTERATKEMLAQWNDDKEGKYKDVFKIQLEGRIEGFQEREHVRLVLTDTPGPNNSQSKEHHKTTMNAIQTDDEQHEHKHPLILYVLNGTQLAVDDDQHLLKLVSEEMTKGGRKNKDRFLFVANKMDAFDPENKNEKISNVLKENVHDYLEANDILNPQIYPVSARLAYLLRKEKLVLNRSDADQLTDKEDGDLYTFKKCFNVDNEKTRTMDMEQYMLFSSRVERKLEDRKLPPLLRRSGVPALEAFIDEYIDKYCFPYRVNHAYEALKKAIHSAISKDAPIMQLDTNANELEKIKKEVDKWADKEKRGFNVKKYIAQIKRESKELPASVKDALDSMQKKPNELFRRLEEELQGRVSLSTAKEKVDKAKKDIEFLHIELLNAYEKQFQSAQEEIRSELQNEYCKYVESLFEEGDKLDLPIKGSIKQRLSGMSLDLKIRNEDIEIKTETEYVTKTRRIERAWYNPLRWFGDTYTNEQYTDTLEKKIQEIDLTGYWKRERLNIEIDFQKLLKDAQKEINSDHSELIDSYTEFLDKTFEPEFEKILVELKTLLSDKEEREAMIAATRTRLEKIEAIKTELENTLEV
jgi:GTPase Era involved in 16S rRNA processing